MADGKRPDVGSDTSADTPVVNAHESDPRLYKDALIGQKLGKCRIDGFIGEGKTALVYRAEYEPLHRTVAVKVLQEHLMKFPAVVKVFQQEGRAVAALDHENILKIYDVGEDKGQHYLVLELLKGDNLLSRIEEYPNGKFPIKEALGIIRQAASGLTAAHRKNLVHRDIKPQNLVIEPDGTLKIVDFGLAAEAEGAFSGGRLGTPHYMSPEQCRGEMAGTASDIYALGVTLFHMLVGHPPYAGRTTTEEIIEGHLEGQRLHPEKLRPDIPRSVADLVRRMTRMDMERRPTAKEIRDALSKAQPAAKAKPRAVRRGRVRGARRRTRSSSSSGAFVVVGVAVLALVLFLMMGGKDDDKGEKTAENNPTQPDPVVVQPTNNTKPKARTKLDAKTRERVREALEKARGAEKAKNWRVALAHYQVVLINAPAASDAYKEAERAAKVLREMIDAERKGTTQPDRKYISAHDSIEAGKEFESRRDAWNERLKVLDFKSVQDGMKTFLEKTRKDSAERGVIELALKRVGYIEALVKMCESRALGLSGGKEMWSNYDPNASMDLIVMGADEKGVKLKEQETDVKSRIDWHRIDAGILIGFMDGIRSNKSAEEALWLGYFCQLLGDGRADLYFDFAGLNDDSPEMKAEIRALRGR